MVIAIDWRPLGKYMRLDVRYNLVDEKGRSVKGSATVYDSGEDGAMRFELCTYTTRYGAAPRRTGFASYADACKEAMKRLEKMGERCAKELRHVRR